MAPAAAPTDAELIVAILERDDRGAFAQLVTRHQSKVRTVLRRLTKGDAGLADDLAQEVWIDVLRQLPRLKDAGAFTTWMYRIAHGKAMLDGRRNGRAPATIPDVEWIAEKEDDTFSAEDAARIHAGLDQLEPPQREVLVLRFLEELSYDEIGEIVGCPLGTVRSRIHYAKAALRRLLEINED